MGIPFTDKNPRSKANEFFGPIGTSILVPVIPSVIYALYFACNDSSGGCPQPLAAIPFFSYRAVSSLTWWKGLWDAQAFLVYCAWMAFNVLAWAILPGDWVDGVELRDGTRQKYKINAFSTLLLAIGLTLGTIIRGGSQSFTWIYEHFLGLVTASIVYSILQTAVLYFWSFKEDKLLALGGNSESHIYNFWIGRELNPTIGSLDLKSFCELRPGLIGWVLINISMACEQAVRSGGHITDSMLLILIFQGSYVFDALYNEPAILTQMDITTDGFGFMLNIGDLSWVPFTYTLQARYLAFNPITLGYFWSTIIFSVNAIGYYIFRASNSEKDEFRKGKNPKNLSFMPTTRGTKLLISGWWGWLQHPNYFGDILMTASWCAATGLRSPIPYFQIVYFVILLLHRQARDNEACEKKYGKDWEVYKTLVPYKIFPYIY
ncbi:hypothetical protein BS47DRAFT_1340003 [Hydnum rufescens UP504]|uniref:Delta(14)-sterol reductase ERG24 n=1 Tax=Hydnum rufescens UP504 TaxID=1448309 RepID=A0A9P6B464_9AGAM|nr:hypothetical protein BS47DRAFT_1340003 [Hydnum rufescens UP504]